MTELYVQLSVDFADDPKMRALVRYGRDARRVRDLYVQMVCYCKRTLSDGFVPDEQVGILVYPDTPANGVRDARRLAEVGLIERVDGGWHIPGFLKRNKSRSAVREDRDRKRAGVVLANHRRWHESRGESDPHCPHCQNSDQWTDHTTDSEERSDHRLVDRDRTDSSEAEAEAETYTPHPPASGGQESPPDITKQRGSDDDPDFTAFWQVYPLKKDKGHARRAWRKATKTTDPHVIVSAAQNYRDSPERKPGFTAYPATWLNGERWNDTPPDPAHNGHRPWWEN